MSLAGSRGGAPLWGLGQRPNCSTGDQFQGSRQQRRRQRSVPATNFALPQERPQATLSTYSILSRQMGATDQHRETTPALVFFIAGNFASADATRGLSARPLDPFGLNTSILDFIRCKGNELPPKSKKMHPDNPLVQERIAGMLAYHRITRTPLQMPRRTPGKTKYRTMQSCRSSP